MFDIERFRVYLCLSLSIACGSHAEAALPEASLSPARVSAPVSRRLFHARRTHIDGFTRFKLKHGNHTRYFHVHVPEDVKSGKKTASGMVMFFHGKGVSADATCGGEHDHGFAVESQAEKQGFIAVCPVGLSGHNSFLGCFNLAGSGWNSDVCCGWPSEHKIDDVGFVRAMLDELESEILPKHYDKPVAYPDRNVFAFGFSAGGLFAYRLACELKDKIHGVAPSGATFNHGFGRSGPIKWAEECATSVPVWNSIGTEDHFTTEAQAVDGFVQYARGKLRCNAAQPGCGFSQPRERVECLEYTECQGAKAKLCVYTGAEHAVKMTDDPEKAYGHLNHAWDFLTSPATPSGGVPTSPANSGGGVPTSPATPSGGVPTSPDNSGGTSAANSSSLNLPGDQYLKAAAASLRKTMAKRTSAKVIHRILRKLFGGTRPLEEPRPLKEKGCKAPDAVSQG